jgi:hypothetical protein
MGGKEASGPQPGESHKERVDRELIELLNELRVVLPGVQVLFAFLLTVPFTGTFGDLDGVQRDAYLTAFFATAFATVCLMTPTTYHRLRFRKGDKEVMLHTSNRFALAGIAGLSVSIVAVVWLVSDLVISRTAANVIAIVTAILVVGAWFGIPLVRRLRDDD